MTIEEDIMQAPTSTMPVVSWRDFVAAYEAAHQHPVNRWVHHATHVGVAIGVLSIAGGHAGWGAALVLVALPVNWAGHAIFERNRPAFLAPADAWGKLQVGLGGLAWTAATLPHDLARAVRSR
jgi:hypothetical protein